MKIKFNWGTGIFIVIVVFLAFFASFIIYSFSHKINLVSEEYFPEEIAYESTLQKIRNSNGLKEKITYKITDEHIILKFPDGFLSNEIKGTVHFFYITDYNHDKKITINLNNEREQYFDLKEIIKGRYTIKIDWSYKETGYYQEIKTSL
jgi:hypothetical protein